MTTRTTPRRRHRHELTERQRSAFSPPCYHAQAAMDAAEQAREDAVALGDMDAITAGEATAANGWHVGADDDGEVW